MKKYLIKEFRELANLTQAQLAELVGCDQPMVQRWENIEEDSNTTITKKNILKLAEALKVHPSKIDVSYEMNLSELIDSAKSTGQYIAQKCAGPKLTSLKQKIAKSVEHRDRDQVLIDILLIECLASCSCDFYTDLLLEKTMTSKFITVVCAFVNALG